MVDNTLNPIPKDRILYKRLSIFSNGQWSFYDTSLLSWTRRNAYFYAVAQFRTGLLRSNEVDPSNVMAIAEIGDYLLLDAEGNLTIIPKDKAYIYV